MKKMLRLEEIEAQAALELPERNLMTTGVLQGAVGALAGNVGGMTDKDGILNTLLNTCGRFNDHTAIATNGTILGLGSGQSTTTC